MLSQRIHVLLQVGGVRPRSNDYRSCHEPFGLSIQLLYCIRRVKLICGVLPFVSATFTLIMSSNCFLRHEEVIGSQCRARRSIMIVRVTEGLVIARPQSAPR